MIKEICIKCIRQYCSEESSRWTADDDNLWNNGRLYCMTKVDPYVNLGDGPPYVSLGDGPPKDCPFILEHIVMVAQKPNE